MTCSMYFSYSWISLITASCLLKTRCILFPLWIYLDGNLSYTIFSFSCGPRVQSECSWVNHFFISCLWKNEWVSILKCMVAVIGACWYLCHYFVWVTPSMPCFQSYCPWLVGVCASLKLTTSLFQSLGTRRIDSLPKITVSRLWVRALLRSTRVYSHECIYA
jgi:hypothetical protein